MTKQKNQDTINIGSDVPQTDPANDAFSSAPFARHIAHTRGKELYHKGRKVTQRS